MNNIEEFQKNNNYYLKAAMAWLVLLLEQKAQREGTTAAELAAAERTMIAAERVEPAPALIRLKQQLKLSQFEANLLLLCVAMELNQNIPQLYGLIQGNERNYPTFYLAFMIFEAPAWDIVSPEKPLRYWQLIEILQSGVDPSITSPLRADEKIINYIKGLNYLDDRLAKLVLPWKRPENSNTQQRNSLPPSQQESVQAIINQLQHNTDAPQPKAIQLLGGDTASKQRVAWEVCQGLNLELYRLPIALLPTDSQVLETIARLWERESRLEPVALYLDVLSCEDYITQGQMAAFYRFLARGNGFFFIDIYDKTSALEGGSLSWDIAKPTSGEQIQAWEKALGSASHRNLVIPLVGQFNLNIAEIEKVVHKVSSPNIQPVTSVEQVKVQQEEVAPFNVNNLNLVIDTNVDIERDRFELIGIPNTITEKVTETERVTKHRVTELHDTDPVSPPPQEDNSLLKQLWDGCLEITQPKLETLAQRIDVKAGWHDIVLPVDEMSLLHQIVKQVRQRGKVYEEWGFHQRMNRGKGISALFAGESGTGKTMAAEVIAKDLRLHLYRIDLATVVSKYIGETEKNLRRLFDAAEDGGAILFFDEADALFGKRSEVKDAHDRYANIEINYLLQRLEAYRGLAILATNKKSTIDQAFLRRLRFIVNFPFPGVAQRAKIWQKVFPKETPREMLDWERLSRFNFTGGNIHSIALNAAFMAAEAGKSVTMDFVLTAARMEFKKLDKLINEADFR
ncbi:ATP-binding protein [Moorena producens JHB]|uniref:ATP-binding protein n=1 Tax=Moorena producens (strain JHB) TaxID=1454205 RepID=A0A9Q9SUY3_MOOP1|nr:ATP-binding protein [Moorena producens]WAN70104.1 ATP-binding protein [Moorena producens JHB]